MPQPDLDLLLQGLSLVPRMASQPVARRQRPAGVALADGELRRVPINVDVGIEMTSHRRLRERLESCAVFGVVADIHAASPAHDHASPSEEQQAHADDGAQHEEDTAQCDWQTEASPPAQHATLLHMRSTGTVRSEAYRGRVKDLERNGLNVVTISMPRVTQDQRCLFPSNSQSPLDSTHVLTAGWPFASYATGSGP